MRALVRPTLLVTVLTVGAQALSVVTQVVAAALFGSSPPMDAYFAATAFPQYATAVLLGALGAVLIPALSDHLAKGDREEAWRVASGVLNLTLLALFAVAAAGLLFAAPILRLTAAGLPSATLDLAVAVARIAWISIIGSGLASLFTSLYQLDGKFGWPAAAPFLGGLLTLALLVVLVPALGIVGLATASTAGFLLQAGVLARILRRPGRYHARLYLGHASVRRVFVLLAPLLLAGLFVRSFTVVERYLAAGLPPGVLSHLGYASRVIALLSVLLATGAGAVLFPRMALHVAGGNFRELRRTSSLGLRVTWLLVAPTVVLLGVLAAPFVAVLFERGAFGATDTVTVAWLLQVFMIAIIPATLGTITGRTLYAMKSVRLLSALGAIESLAYIGYTFVLAQWFGATGVALGFTVYMSVSLVWQFIYLRWRLGPVPGAVPAYARTAVAALVAGGAAWLALQVTPIPSLQLAIGLAAGGALYAACLWMLRSEEALRVWQVGRALVS